MEEEVRKAYGDVVKGFFEEFSQHKRLWQYIINQTATLDCLLSLAAYKDKLGAHPSCYPEFEEYESEDQPPKIKVA